MDSLPWPAIGLGSGWTLVVLGVILLARGWLFTKPQMDAIEAAHKRELERIEAATAREVEDANHERSEWRTEARLNQQTAVELNEQNRAMLNAFGPTLTDFLQSLRALAQKRTNQGETGDEQT